MTATIGWADFGTQGLPVDGEQVLIVDDESSIREVLSSLLADEGFRPLAAGTAEEGLERMAGADVSVALIDIKLPGMDGIELLDYIIGVATDELDVERAGSA